MKRLLKGKTTDLGAPQAPSAPGNLPGGDPSVAFKAQASGKRNAQQLRYDLILLFRWVKSNTLRENLTPSEIQEFPEEE